MEQIKQLIVLIEQKNDEKLSSVLKDLKSIKDNNSLVDTDILKTLNEILNVSKTINKDDIEEIRNEVKTISESINKKQDNPLMEDLITAIKNIKIEQPSEISIKGMGKLKGATGEKGDKGDNGYTPIKGVDYFDGEKGEKGKDGSPDTPEQIVEKINTLENVIDIKTIKDFPVIEGTADIKRQMDTIGNQVLRLLSNVKAVKTYIDNSVSTETENAQSGTSYTFALTDGGKMVTGSNSSPTTFTVPTNLSVGFPIGTRIDVLQIGTGKITIANSVGVTLLSQGGNKTIKEQYVACTLWKKDTDLWYLMGNLQA